MTERNESLRKRIKAMRRKSPHRPAADMARELGISRQRALVILRELGLPARPRYETEATK